VSKHSAFKITSFTASGQSEDTIEGSEVEVGRNISSDFAIMANGVSRKHLLILNRSGKVFLKDLGSTNGTFLKGERIEPLTEIPYTPGDRVSLGQAGCFIKISLTDGASATSRSGFSEKSKAPASGSFNEQKMPTPTNIRRSSEDTGIFGKFFGPTGEEKEKVKASKYIKNAESLVKQRIKEAEDSIKKGIEKARTKAKDIVVEARREAEQVVNDATKEKENIVEKAKIEAARIDKESHDNFIKREEEIVAKKEEFVRQLDESKNELLKLKEEKSTLTDDISGFRTKKELLESDFNNLQERYNGLDDKFKDKNDGLKAALMDLEKSVRENQDKLDELVREQESIHGEYLDKVEEAEKKFNQLSEDHTRYTNEVLELTELKENLLRDSKALQEDKDKFVILKEGIEKDFIEAEMRYKELKEKHREEDENFASIITERQNKLDEELRAKRAEFEQKSEKRISDAQEKSLKILNDAKEEIDIKRQTFEKDLELQKLRFNEEKEEILGSLSEKEKGIDKKKELILAQAEEEKRELLSTAEMKVREAEELKANAVTLGEEEKERIVASAKGELESLKKEKEQVESEIEIMLRDIETEKQNVLKRANDEAKELLDNALEEKELILKNVKLKIEQSEKDYDERMFQADKYFDEKMKKADAYYEETSNKADDILQTKKIEADKYSNETISSADDYKNSKITEADEYHSDLTSKSDQYHQDRHKEADEYYAEKKDLADNYLQKQKDRYDQELKEHKDSSYSKLEKEIAEYKVSETVKVEKEVEAQKKLLNNYKVDFATAWSQAISQSFYKACVNDLDISITDSNAFKERMKHITKSIILDQNPDEEDEIKGLMNFDPSKKDRVKKYWKRTAMTLAIGAVALYLSPYFFGFVKEQAVVIVENNDAQSKQIIKDIEEKRKVERTFVPVKKDEYFDSYTQRVVYTTDYVENELKGSYREDWFLNLDTFFVEDLILSDEAIVTFISKETNLIKKLTSIRDDINPKFVDEGITRMQALEDDFISQVKEILKTKAKYKKFVKFKKDYYLKNYPLGSSRELAGEDE